MNIRRASSMSNIPSEQDFARAKKLARERFRNLSDVSKSVRDRFKDICPLHNVYVLPQDDVDFRAYVFFNTDKDTEQSKRSGIIQELTNFLFEELERFGRGKKGEITIAVEVDSDENVTNNFEGDYFLRLR
jgi:hypothetical protein